MVDAVRRLFWRRHAGHSDVETRLGNVTRRARAAALICDHRQTVTLGCEPQNRPDKILAIGTVDPRRAQDDVPRISGPDPALARELAAAVGIERRHRILFDIGRALSPVEHIIGRDMDKRNPAMPGVGRKSRWRLGVDRERDRFIAFGTINVSIGGRVDDRTPRLRRDDPRDRSRIFQIELGPGWRHNFNILGKLQPAKLLADLASPAKQQEAHPVTRSSWKARGECPRRARTRAAPTRRGSLSTISRSP
jgi:hypothetical protein